MVYQDNGRARHIISTGTLGIITCQNYHFGLLAKITILASMLVGHVCPFVTCQNLILASMFVGRVCLFVCYLPKSLLAKI